MESVPTTFRYVSINGELIDEDSKATVSIWDTSFHRGDGVFEVMRLLPSGQVRGLEHHMVRLQTSAAAVGCPLPQPAILQQWILQAATTATNSPLNQFPDHDGAPGCLRLIATKGGKNPPDDGITPSLIISWSPLPQWPESFTLMPVLAPWHCAGAPGWETPIKWTSYGPNVVSTQKAKAGGFADALLVSSLRLADSLNPSVGDCHVLDGPNFAITWIRGHTLYLPDTKTLGLLPSITQELVRSLAENELKMTVEKGVFALRDLWQAEEVFVSSTTRGIIPIETIGEYTFAAPTSSSSYTRKLQALLTKANGMD